jgi:hypothetical protein
MTERVTHFRPAFHPSFRLVRNQQLENRMLLILIRQFIFDLISNPDTTGGQLPDPDQSQADARPAPKALPQCAKFA